MTKAAAVLLFDGTCGFCARSVQFVLQHDRRRGTLRFASLESAMGRDLRRRHPELGSVDTVIWFEPGDATRTELVAVRSAAVLRVLRYLGGPWPVLAALGTIVPRALRDRVYDVVARYRHQLVRGGPACLIPTAEQRARFIEWNSAA